MGFKYRIVNDGIYFMTFSVVDWVDVFTRKELADIVIESLKYCQREKGLILYAWCLMPSHIHLIASAGENGNLSDIMRDLKKFTSKQIIAVINTIPESTKDWMLNRFEFAGRYNPIIKDYKFWQDGLHSIELRTETFAKQKLDYLHENPVSAGLVWEPWQYQYSSAIDYWGIRKGLLEIEVLM